MSTGVRGGLCFLRGFNGSARMSRRMYPRKPGLSQRRGSVGPIGQLHPLSLPLLHFVRERTPYPGAYMPAVAQLELPPPCAVTDSELWDSVDCAPFPSRCGRSASDRNRSADSVSVHLLPQIRVELNKPGSKSRADLANKTTSTRSLAYKRVRSRLHRPSCGKPDCLSESRHKSRKGEGEFVVTGYDSGSRGRRLSRVPSLNLR